MVVLFCHPLDALFGPCLLMPSSNSLACFCGMMAGISTLTGCGTLLVLTLAAVGKACACIAPCALLVTAAECTGRKDNCGKCPWNNSVKCSGLSMVLPLSSFLTVSCKHSNEGLLSLLPSSHCSSCKYPCLHVGKVLVCECKCCGLMMEVPSPMYRVSLISSQIRNSPTRKGDQSPTENNEWLVGKNSSKKQKSTLES